MILEASCPTTYRKSGLSEVTASRMAFATSDGCIAFWIICFDDSDSLIFTLLYGKLLVDSNFESDDEYNCLDNDRERGTFCCLRSREKEHHLLSLSWLIPILRWRTDLGSINITYSYSTDFK
jgi:hypothetical protein